MQFFLGESFMRYPWKFFTKLTCNVRCLLDLLTYCYFQVYKTNLGIPLFQDIEKYRNSIIRANNFTKLRIWCELPCLWWLTKQEPWEDNFLFKNPNFDFLLFCNQVVPLWIWTQWNQSLRSGYRIWHGSISSSSDLNCLNLEISLNKSAIMIRLVSLTNDNHRLIGWIGEPLSRSYNCYRFTC